MKKIFYTILSFAGFTANAQCDVTAVTAPYTASSAIKTYTLNGATGSPLSPNMYDYNFGASAGTANNIQNLTGFTACGNAYLPIASLPIQVYFRRGTATPSRSILYYHGLNIPAAGASNTMLKLERPYEESMETIFNGYNNFNAGTDNIFVNQGDGNGNNNNIERADVIFPMGATIADVTKAGIALFERGDNNAHDAFSIAIVTAIDGSNNPTAYHSTIKVMANGGYGNTVLLNAGGGTDLDYYILRKEISSSNNLQHSAFVSQNMGGVFFKFSDFGIANGTTVYGYSIMANDAGATIGANFLSYGTVSNPYKNNTSSANGGLDLVAITGIANLTGILPIKFTNLSVQKSNNSCFVNWEIENADDVHHFEIEQSLDGTHFTKMGMEVKTLATAYTFSDANFNTAFKYYRIKAINADGTFYYSKVQFVKNNSLLNAEYLSAMPLQKDFIQMSIKATAKEEVVAKLVSLSGQILSTQKINLVNGNNFVQINLPKTVTSNQTIILQVKGVQLDYKKTIIKM